MRARLASAIVATLTGAVALATTTPADAATRSESDYTYQAATTGRPALKLRAYWYRLTTGTRPAVVLVHGGAWVSGDYRSMDTAARYLTDHGYQVFSIQYPLATQARWPAQRTAVLSAYDWVKSHAAAFDIRTTRIFLGGSSAGGHIVTNAGTYGRGGGRYRGVFALSPVADPHRAYTDGTRPGATSAQADLARSATTLAGCDTPDDHLACQARFDTDMASKARADRYDPPMYLVYGVSEWVSPQHSKDLCAKLKVAGVSCTLKATAGSGHGLTNWSAQRANVLAWLNSRAK